LKSNVFSNKKKSIWEEDFEKSIGQLLFDLLASGKESFKDQEQIYWAGAITHQTDDI
jgi:hypothetical protein